MFPQDPLPPALILIPNEAKVGIDYSRRSRVVSGPALNQGANQDILHCPYNEPISTDKELTSEAGIAQVVVYWRPKSYLLPRS